MLNVIFDISVLNEITASTANRTGIFRVVDRLALQLASRPECQISFSCNNIILDIDSILEKVASNYPELAGVKAARVWGPEMALTEYISVRRAIQQLKANRQKTITYKLQLEFLRAQGSMLKRRVKFNSSALIAGGVFHSPWDPLPPRHLFPAGSCGRAITLYDMTPVLFPHFFQGNERTLASFKAILTSIAPDDHVIAISECTKRDFCQLTGHDPGRVSVTPLAADEKMFYAVHDAERISRIRSKYGIAEGHYVLSVNTLQPRKNIAHCIQSFAKLLHEQKIHDLSLVLVGDRGWGTKEIDEAQRTVGLNPNQIVVTGYIPDHDLAALYSGAMAFIYVSHYEGFGLPALEAMQCGTPVIASNTSSMPEVVGGAGLMVNPTDGDALCAAILSLYAKPSLRESYVARALGRATQFSWAKCADDTVLAYRNMLN